MEANRFSKKEPIELKKSIIPPKKPPLPLSSDGSLGSVGSVVSGSVGSSPVAGTRT